MKIRGLESVIFVAVMLTSFAANAQLPLPADTAPPDGAALFANQCGTCHTLNPAEPPRQGPNLAHVVGRKAGSVAGFAYSEGLARADWVWDEARLDTWLANPQAVIDSTVMAYKQANPATRKQIIDWLKEQH